MLRISPLNVLTDFYIMPTKMFYIGVRQVIRTVWTISKMNEEMQAHKEEILKGYEEFSTSIRDCFNQ